MKTYLKRNADKSSSSSLFYSYSDPRPRIIQPSTKEQQRLLSNSNPNRFQHVHWGKYGIKPIWPDEKLANKPNSIEENCFWNFLRNEQNSWSKFQSDSKKYLSAWIDQTDRSTLILLSVSLIAFVLLLLLLLVYAANRRDEKNRPEKRQKLKSNRINRENDEQTAPIRILPTIVEENSPATSSANVENKQNVDQTTTIRKRRSRFDEPSNVPEEKLTSSTIEQENSSKLHHHVIADEFTSLEQINKAVQDVGLVRSQLIFGIDYTISNLETGKHSFNGFSLHHIQKDLLNPYQSVITIIGRTLERFDSDMLIPAFGFGDRATLDRKIFPLRPDGTYCKGFIGVLEAYNEVTPKVRMSGPTNFAPLIREAIRIVKKTRQYHILVIVADGQVTNERQTKDAIVEASNYPLSIVMVGVGDGPWDMMNEFDDSLPTRQFDNFQFVNYNSVVQAANDQDSAFALNALMEIPSQYTAIKKLGLLQEN